MMKPLPNVIREYHVFLASPGDVGAERQYVRKFFAEYNRDTASFWNERFEVVDWENYATIGIGRPQELITQDTLEKYRKSLVLVVGIMNLRFGKQCEMSESGTEEEFNWAMQSHQNSGFPEIKWFFRERETLDGLPADPAEAIKALEQWQKVCEFRKRIQDQNNPVFYATYPNSTGFAEVFRRDLTRWLNDSARPWVKERATGGAIMSGAVAVALPAEFDAERYREAVLKRYDKLNFELLDTTGAFYSPVRLSSVFVPQSVRECHQYNPRLLEIPKEHQRRLLEAGEITEIELEKTEQQSDRLRQEYYKQPLRPVQDVVDEALDTSLAGVGQKLVILGDPGSGKSSLVRYLALRWAGIAEPAVRDTQLIPLVVELGAYARWQCEGRKDFILYLEEGPVWHEWPSGQLSRLLAPPGRRIFLLLDGLDEVFDLPTREMVINDIQRFCTEFAHVPVLLTSRVVGYQAQRLREADFRHFMLQDLDSSQISDFMTRWHEVTFDDPAYAAPKRDRLQIAIRESKSIAMLAGNPLLLTMMAILNRNQELPRDRADLYAQTSRVLLHQWDTERALEDFPGMSTEIGLREKTDILRRLAAHMQAGPSGLKGNLVDGSTLTDLIEDYLQNDLSFTQARAAARAVVEQLRKRSFILCFVGADSYAFVHRTFLEYFCAADFVHQFNIAKTLDIEGLIELFDEHCRDDEWREVLRLICGQIDDQFVVRIVERLTTRTELKEWYGRTPLPELPLAIGCFSELRTLARMEELGAQLLRQIIGFLTMAHGKKTNRLQERQLKEFMETNLLGAVREIGPKWPGKALLKACAVTHVKHLGELGNRVWPSLVCALIEDPEPLRALAVLSHRLDSYGWARGVALQRLAEKWPDQTTRDLLTERAVQDENEYTRRAALVALAEKWPDQITRDLLTEIGAEYDNPSTRADALEALAEKWPNQTTRDLLAERAIQDGDTWPRRAALQALAKMWPDQTTRDLLTEIGAEYDNPSTRAAALEALAEKWPNQTTRDLLAERAIQDGDAFPRHAALQALAKMWPDQTTRDLLTERAFQDGHERLRIDALRALAKKWPDQTTRDLLAQLAIEGPTTYVRKEAGLAMFRIHSKFGCILSSVTHDPFEPIRRRDIELAAAETGIRPDDINDQLDSLSAHLGWDVVAGRKQTR